MNPNLDMLKELAEVFGPPGFEDEVYSLMKSHVGDFTEVSSDNIGSFVAKLPGKSTSPRIMIAGHMDEVGFIVREITKEGFVKISPIGGWWPHVVLAQRVTIKTRKGIFTGVTGSKPPHMLEPKDREKVLELKDIFVDFGVESDFKVEEELGIRRGDPIVPYSPYEVMGNPNLLLAKAWDNRIGCAAAIDVLKAMKKVDHPNTIYGVGTVMEEVGLRGAITAADVVKPDIAFAVDVSLTMDSPGFNGENPEKLGAGACLIFHDASMITNPRLLQFCIDVAEEEGIKYHLSSLTRGAYDTGRIHLYGSGVLSIPIGVPSRYVHSHTSIIHKQDYAAVVDLLVALVKRIDADKIAELKNRG